MEKKEKEKRGDRVWWEGFTVVGMTHVQICTLTWMIGDGA